MKISIEDYHLPTTIYQLPSTNYHLPTTIYQLIGKVKMMKRTFLIAISFSALAVMAEPVDLSSQLETRNQELETRNSKLETRNSKLETQNSYTNHAGNVISGVVVALDMRTVTISNSVETVKLPLSIFPEAEQRRIAADFGQPRLPIKVKRAIDGAEKAMARSRKRANKGLCTKEESDAFCEKSEAALKSYLDKQVESGVITPAERNALGR